MDNSNSRTSHDVYLQLLPDHCPLLVTEPLFDIIKKALASSQDRSESAAQEIDSILSAHLESDVLEKASFEGQRCYEFFSKLLKVLLESALQIPIENEFLHARLAGIIIQVSKIEREEILERDQIYRWHELPEMWIGFEEKWHSEYGIESLEHCAAVSKCVTYYLCNRRKKSLLYRSLCH